MANKPSKEGTGLEISFGKWFSLCLSEDTIVKLIVTFLTAFGLLK
ncbi:MULTISPECIES: hypothetical protein [Erysipelotrichaceae]|nr:hypothetical protein [Absiella sp. AM27-20]